MTLGSFLTASTYAPWLDAARARIDPYYWDRYRKLLAGRGFSGDVLSSLDKVTDQILDFLENPTKGESWDRRGMVVGHVQSGKTANYTGLICKAADAGYRLIIVIAGIHNNLRNQTQERIDDGFVGRDTARLLSNKDDPAQRFIGVGCIDRSRRPVTFTNSIKDFSKALATGVGVPIDNLKEPAIFVVKKNSSTLKNLISWLQEHNKKAASSVIDVPMLLIDDEADNASINTAQAPEEATKINEQIRSLLQLFARRCYVGYTATPFANIFIDPGSSDEMLGQDLFPKDFIISLDPPSNYFGAERIFLEEGRSVIRFIQDNEELLPLRHAKDFLVADLPPSLEKAVRVFILSRAIRISRGHQRQHCSMLINASRFTEVQKRIHARVHQLVEKIRASVRVHSSLPVAEALKDPEIAMLRKAWEEEYGSDECSKWSVVQPLLLEAIGPVKVTIINSKSAEKLDYGSHAASGLNVIAVGGFSLSRGLTLEGLTVSYFLRNSIMYDTLMQMGRWFGYRLGYEDLCRVWMVEEAEGWYSHIAESIEELREELRAMSAAGATPEQFGLKVRNHPDTLIVTARNKMRTGKQFEVVIGLANKFVETSVLRGDDDSLQANRNNAVSFAKRLSAIGMPVESAVHVSGGYLLSGVPVHLVREFVSAFVNHSVLSQLSEPAQVCQYIDARSDGELSVWDVLFASVQKNGEDQLIDVSLGIPIYCQRRSEGIQTRNDPNAISITSKRRVASRGVEKAGLTQEQIEKAEAHYRAHDGNKPLKVETRNYPDRIYRSMRKRPLLVVHLLGIGEKDEDMSNKVPVVAWSISFPETSIKEHLVSYIVNTTWVKEYFPEEFDDLELGGQDDF